MRAFPVAGGRAGRALALVLLLGLVTSLVVAYAMRQDAGAQAEERRPAVEMPRPFPPIMPQFGGAGLAMVVYKDYIYIAHGGTLYKINPETMTVVEELQFVKPPAVPLRPQNPPPPPGTPQ
jgi:hypothetical protein